MASTSGKTANCRLCLTETNSTNERFPLQGDVRRMMQMILAELNVSICVDPSICKTCLDTLKKCYKFKSYCLKVDEKLDHSTTSSKPFKVDLTETLSPSDEEKYATGNFEICRTCLGLGKKELCTQLGVYEGDPLRDMIVKCLPEINLSRSKNPAICPVCLEELEEQFHFTMQCLDTETKINVYSESKKVFCNVDLGQVNTFSLEMENSHFDSMIEEEESYTEQEDIKPKTESESDDYDQEADMLQIKEEVHVERAKRKCTFKTEELESEDEEPKTKKVRRRTRQCTECDFKTKFPSRFKAHMTRKHGKKEETNEKIFKCRTCTFQTLLGDDYAKHKREHKFAKAQKCPYCTMSFIRPDFLSKHLKQHLKTNIEPKLEKNMTKARQMPNVFNINGKVLKMYRCRLCTYQSRLKSNHDKHMLSHNVSSNIVKHKCKLCPFETIQKENFQSHLLKHESESEQRALKCFLCSFESLKDAELKQHVIQVHKSSG